MLFCQLAPLIVVSHGFRKTCDVLLVKARGLEGAEVKPMLWGWSGLSHSCSIRGSRGLGKGETLSIQGRLSLAEHFGV